MSDSAEKDVRTDVPGLIMAATLDRIAERHAEKDAPLYEWDIEVQRLDNYGQRVEERTPAKVLASTRAEVTGKVRTMFGATYDDFRKFWSHTWALNSVQEVQRIGGDA